MFGLKQFQIQCNQKSFKIKVSFWQDLYSLRNACAIFYHVSIFSPKDNRSNTMQNVLIPLKKFFHSRDI